ncbi:MAG TPA: sialate O-acetylesterase [Kiritimatiellia bacterium]|nr:sialate O-acetylesterase [Kiritimatiellia bacterium]
MKKMRKLGWVGAILLAGSVQAAVRMPKIFGDGMVLQQQVAVPVWGWAAPGERVTVTFAGQSKETAAKADGTWSLKLDALQASSEPARLEVRGANALTFSDVVVGEVWFCSGQSNMEWTMRSVDHAEKEIAAANLPLIRHFKAPKRVSGLPLDDVNAVWEKTSPAGIGDESAVAFLFGRRLHQVLNVPIGLINCSWGGTRIEPWTPLCGFEGIPALEGILRNAQKRVEQVSPGSTSYKATHQTYFTRLQEWIAESEKRLAANQAVTAMPEYPPVFSFRNQDPTVLFNGMVAGLVPYAIRGAIWYQGCSNNGEGMLYLEKTKALVKGWRQVWGQGDFPYYLVQLAPYTYGGNPENLPGIWEAQAAVPAAIPNTGYTVINDIGNIRDIHPRNKQDVGLRLANQALNRTYGRSEIAWAGPVYRSFAIEGQTVCVTFDHAEGLKTRDGQPPTWFEICGEDGRFVKADAKIDGTSVILSASSVSAPKAMRFAWNQIAEPNLVNGIGLPAGAFRCGK